MKPPRTTPAVTQITGPEVGCGIQTEQIPLLFMEIALALAHTLQGDRSRITLYYKDKMFSPDILRYNFDGINAS